MCVRVVPLETRSGGTGTACLAAANTPNANQEDDQGTAPYLGAPQPPRATHSHQAGICLGGLCVAGSRALWDQQLGHPVDSADLLFVWAAHRGCQGTLQLS